MEYTKKELIGYDETFEHTYWYCVLESGKEIYQKVHEKTGLVIDTTIYQPFIEHPVSF